MNRNVKTIYLTQPHTNIDGKTYDKLDDAITAADIKIDWGTREIKIYECRLTHIISRGTTTTERLVDDDLNKLPDNPGGPESSSDGLQSS